MHIVITRPEHDSTELRSRIEDIGCTVSLAPLLKIEFQDIPPGALAGAGGIIATSRNALRALARSQALETVRHLPVFTVGPATSSLATSIGFRDVREGDGTAASLVPLIAGSRTSGGLVHLAGDHLAFNLAEALAAAGQTITAWQAYRSVAAKTLPADVLEHVRAGTIDAVVLMSPRSAATWAALMQPHVGTQGLSGITHICLSPAVRQALQTLGPIKALTAQKPVLEEIVALVYRLAAEANTG